MKKQLTLFFFGVLFISTSLLAQEQTDLKEGDKVAIETVEGNKLIGTIQAIDQKTIQLDTESMGILSLQKEKIKKLKQLSAANFVDGAYWFDHPNRTRYFIAPTAFGLKQGEGYYQNIQLFYNGIGYGFTDNFSVSVGGNFLIQEANFLLFNPQFSFPVDEKIHLGVGSTITLLPNDEFSSFLYGVATFGNSKANFSVSLGYGFNENEFARTPFTSFSGQFRVSKNIALVSENFLIPSRYDDIFIANYGLRFLTRSASIDFGFLVTSGVTEFFTLGIPFITVVIPFGKR